MLEEAAAELFLEQTYAGTTIEQITRRAGVSRNTFFNYFPAKSDLLWVDIDAGLAGLPRALDDCSPDLPVTDAVRSALLIIAAGFGPGNVPWALTQDELMGTTGELAASALSRFLVYTGMLADFVGKRAGLPKDAVLCQGFTMAVLASAAAATGVWARAGVSRGNLAPFVDAFITPVCEGYRMAEFAA